MKMISSVLGNIQGIEIYYIIGLLLFVAFFVVIVIRTLRMPSKEADHIKNSILNDYEIMTPSNK